MFMGHDLPRRLCPCVALASALAVSACAAAPSSNSVDTTTRAATTNSALIATAAAAAEFAPRLDEVWPGYWPQDQTFTVYQPGGAVLLVTSAAAPAGFEPLRRSTVPSELRGRAYLHPGPLPGLESSFLIGFPVGEPLATAVALDSADIRGTLATLFHEAFHAYQAQFFAASSAGEYVDPDLISSPEFQAMAEIERQMLHDALNLPLDSLHQHLRAYLAVRSARSQSVPEAISNVERKLERSEGSAHLVGIEAALLATGGERQHLGAALAPYLTAPMDSFSGNIAERLIRWRVYGTGSAIGLLLTRLGADWKMPLQRGAGFEELLRQAVAFDAADAPAVATEALERYGFAERMANAPSQGAAPLTLEGFYASAAIRMVLEFAVPVVDGKPEMQVNFSAGAGGFSQLEENLIVLPEPDVFTLQVPGVSIIARGAPMLYDVRGISSLQVRVTAMVPAVPDVNGNAPLPVGQHRLERLDVNAAGVELVITRPVRIRVTGSEMFITVEPGDQP